MDKIKVMIVDDQSLMRDGLSTILETQDDIRVVSQAQNGQIAIDLVENIMPDVILMDIRMPIVNGVEATKNIKSRFPAIHVIILTTFDDDDFIIDALSYGASGYLLKDIDGSKLIQSVRDAVDGNLLLPGAIAKKLASNISRRNITNNSIQPIILYDSFTQREIEISNLMVQGFTSKQIAEKLFLTQGTVKNYITSIYSKIGTNDRVKAILILQKLCI